MSGGNEIVDVSVINVSLKDESVCLLTDICFQSDFFIVVDSESRRVKRFRKHDNVLQDYIFLEDPCGVCRLKLSSHIIVTEPCKRHLTYVSVDDKMILSSRRKTTKRYSPIRCLDENRIVVGCCELSNASVDILDYTGKILQCINNNEKQVPLFLTPSYLACHNENYIIISDSGTKHITCLNINEKVEWSLALMYTPSGVCVTKSGNLYVCLYNESKILIVDSLNHGKITGKIGYLPLKNPLSIVFSTGSIYATEEMPSNRVTRIQVNYGYDINVWFLLIKS